MVDLPPDLPAMHPTFLETFETFSSNCSRWRTSSINLHTTVPEDEVPFTGIDTADLSADIHTTAYRGIPSASSGFSTGCQCWNGRHRATCMNRFISR